MANLLNAITGAAEAAPIVGVFGGQEMEGGARAWAFEPIRSGRRPTCCFQPGNAVILALQNYKDGGRRLDRSAAAVAGRAKRAASPMMLCRPEPSAHHPTGLDIIP